VKIFVCEFVTGGGLYREPMPFSLAREGGLMLQALLEDLMVIPGVEVLTSRDQRLPPLDLPVEQVRIDVGEDAWRQWERCIQMSDAVWLIAPESGGALERLSSLSLSNGKLLLGCLPQAITLAASKHATASALQQSGIQTIPTFMPMEIPSGMNGPFVAKPDDGVGCEDTRCFPDRNTLMAWLALEGRMRSHVVQPFLLGTPASLSMICRNGESWLLSCNRQRVLLEEGRFIYRGSVLNDMAPYWEEFARIGRDVAKAIDGLAGYVGVDVLVNCSEIIVLEVNPRLTTSYVGLSRATGSNPARLVLELLYNESLTSLPAIARNIVEVSLDE
jgi:predicted ATP-grasp superfamily ATP-dependent carboligase